MCDLSCEKIKHKCNAECCNCFAPIECEIYEKHKDKAQRKILEIKKMSAPFEIYLVITEDGRCVFLDENLNCSIYEDRPQICKLFGSESHSYLVCRWLSKDSCVRSRQKRRQIERKQKAINRKKKECHFDIDSTLSSLGLQHFQKT